jgi:hypothetical protein
LSLPIIQREPINITSYRDKNNIYTNISKRIVIIADIHSDYDRFNNILQNAKILDKNNKWIAENILLVQLGDQIDRKAIDKYDISNKHHFRLTYYTDYLKKEAKKYDSDVVSLIGNHELMNIDKIRNKEAVKNIIADRPVLFKFYKYLFCHGGYTKSHHDILNTFKKDIEDINIIWNKYVMDIELSAIETEILNYLILNTTDSILYIRKDLDTKDFLHNLDIEYMFVGHNETKNIHLKSKVWYLDQMLKTAFDNNNYNYLEIIDDTIFIRSLK